MRAVKIKKGQSVGKSEHLVRDMAFDFASFVVFTPTTGHQHRHWRVLGVPQPHAKGHARFNGRIGALLGTIGFRHAIGYAVVLQFDDGATEAFCAHDLAPCSLTLNDSRADAHQGKAA